jgi:hypothetical protein
MAHAGMPPMKSIARRRTAPEAGAPCGGTPAAGGIASDRERRRPVGIMGVEAAFAFGAEEVSHAYGLLTQYEFELMCAALRADFANAAESQYVKRLLFIVEVIDHHAWIQFAENQVVVGGVMSSAR